MRPEEEKGMHTSESRPTDNNTGVAREYPLETLMGLQKLLEDGIPEQATSRHQQSSQALPAGPNPRQSEPAAPLRSHRKFSDIVRDWAGRLRSLLVRDKKSKTAGRGSSAQQQG